MNSHQCNNGSLLSKRGCCGFLCTYIQTQGSSVPTGHCVVGDLLRTPTQAGEGGEGMQEGNFRVLQREWVLGMGTDSLRTIGSEDEEEEQKVFRVR